MTKQEWYQLEESQLLEILETKPGGLSLKKAEDRLESYGKNELPTAKKDSLLKMFISQFIDSIIFIMIVACIVSFVIGEYVDGIVIIFIIILDAVMGTVQEWKAGKSADALKEMIKAKAIAIREQKEQEIDASLLVPGDVVLLQSGSKVPADARIISCANLTVDESALTGESVANMKQHSPILEKGGGQASNMVYAGTNVITGRATCIVVETGPCMEIGKIANQVLKTGDAKSPLTIRVDKFSKQISIFIIIMATGLILLLFAKQFSFDEIILSVVALAVSAMPEGLPLALTLALTIGSTRMAKRNIIVKKLKAVETLGSCTVIASDKTGTLTVNEQTAKKIVLPDHTIYDISGTGYNSDGSLKGPSSSLTMVSLIAKCGLINNEATLFKKDQVWHSHGDSIDIAFLALAAKTNIDSLQFETLGLIPYESENKYSAAFYREDNKIHCTVKGSLETVLSFCDTMYINDQIVPLNQEDILLQNEKLAATGYRVIALAEQVTDTFCEKDFYDYNDIPFLTFLGLVAFIDPVRKETKDAVRKCKKAGIKVVMITGDHPLTAYSIACELGLATTQNEVASGDQIEQYLFKGEQAFDEFVKKKKVFTRVTPIQKLEIVESYKRMGEFVAVTGDGVNDAPALKVANIGIAMGSGTDVAKETSAMILTDDNFLSIEAGVEEGRTAYANIRKVIYMLISCGLAEVLFFVLSIIFGFPMPLIAIQLLWLNLVTDGLQDLALSFEKTEDGVMDQPPRKPKEPLFDRLLIQEIILAGLSIGILVFIWWVVLNKLNTPIEIARGYIMTLMVFMQNIHVLNCRSETKSTFKLSLKSNRFIVVSIFLAILLQIIVMEVPLISELFQVQSIPLWHLFLLFASSLPILLVMELFKKRQQKA